MGLLRCWVIRGLILAALAAAGAGGWVAYGWVSPDRVRDALAAALRAQFPDADVEVGAARVRLFGGVTVSGLRVTRRGDPAPFFEAPTAVISPDKERLGQGRLVVRKVEVDGPTVRLARRADGTWNAAGLVKPGPAGGPVPTLVVRNATVLLTDDRPGGLPPVGLLGARLTVLNDPLPVLKVDAQFAVAPGATGPAPPPGGLLIPVAVTAKVDRPAGAARARVDVPDLTVTPDLAPVVAKVDPALAEYAAEFAARVGVRADLCVQPGRPLKYDVRVDVRDGRWDGDGLPWPVEGLAASLRIQDGRVTVDRGTARLGKAAVDFALETRAPADATQPALPGPRLLASRHPAFRIPHSAVRTPPSGDPLGAVEDRLDRLSVTVRDLALDDDLFARLPAGVREAAERKRRLFRPTGTVDVGVEFRRAGGGWAREVEVRPNRLAVEYSKFRYPVTGLGGAARLVAGSDGPAEWRVGLTGTAGGRRVELSGRVLGAGPDPMIDLTLAGADLPIDAALVAAFPPRYAAALGDLRAAARGDFAVRIRQPAGVNRTESTFDVRVYDGALNDARFPYPLTGVRGLVTVRVVGVEPRPGGPPDVDEDTVEVREFEGVHADGRVWVPAGGSHPVPGTRDRRLTLRVLGAGCPVDADLRAAMAAVKLDDAWRAFAPRGRVTFGADIEVVDRAPAAPPAPAGVSQAAAALPGEPGFDPAADLRVTVNFAGPTVTPGFFPYQLDDLAGVVRYAGGKVALARVSARHGAATLGLDAAEVRVAGGLVWANLGGLRVDPLVPDGALLAALPPGLRAGAEKLRLKGPMALLVKHLVIQVPPDRPEPAGVPLGPGVARGQCPAGPDPVVYWNAELRLAGAGLDTGLSWDGVHGAVASVGRYDGTHLGAVFGNAWFDTAAVAGQPVTGVKASFRVAPQQPDPGRPGAFLPPAVEVPDLTAVLCRGTVGGQARVVLADPVGYRVWLTAGGVRLDDLAGRLGVGAGAELRGLAQGEVLVESRPDPRTGAPVPTGSGVVAVPHGRMLNLPVLVPLLKLLKLQAPDQTAFEEAHARFDVRGDRVTVTHLDLIGTAVSLGGAGELAADGADARFEFHTVWSQALRRWLAAPLGDAAATLSGTLFKIEVVHKDGKTDYRPHMLPGVTSVMQNAKRKTHKFDPAPGRPDP